MQPLLVIFLMSFLVIIKRGKAGYVMFQVDKELKNANVPRTIRFTEGLFEELAAVAQQEGISFNLLVLQCCRYALRERETNEE